MRTEANPQSVELKWVDSELLQFMKNACGIMRLRCGGMRVDEI